VLTLLSTVANGSGSSERIGRKISYYDISIRYFLTANSVHLSNYTRIMVVYDNSPNGTAPAYTDIIQNSATTSFENPDTRGRFKILHDKTIYSATSDVVDKSINQFGTGSIAASHTQTISLKGKTAQFLGTGSSISDYEKGAIYLLTNSFQNNVMYLEFANRIQFYDA